MKQAERKQAYIVGIAGESAGGKSTLADSLEKGLAGYKVKMFHLDAAEGREGKCTGLKGQKLAGSVWRNRYDNSKTGRIVSSRRGIYSDKKSKEWSL